MSETPIFIVPAERALSDREIENPHESYAELFDLEREEFDVAPPIWAGSEIDHETVQAPTVIHRETLTHEQQLLESVNHTPERELIAGIGSTGVNMVAMRRMTTSKDYALAA